MRLADADTEMAHAAVSWGAACASFHASDSPKNRWELEKLLKSLKAE